MDDYFGYSIKFGEIFEGNGFRRELAVVSNAASPKLPSSWKASLWERSSIEPAIFRVPIIIIAFLFLWLLNLWMLERNRMQYHGALSIKAAPFAFTAVWATVILILYALAMTIVPNVLAMGVEAGIMTFYALVLLLVLTPGLPGQETKTAFMKLIRFTLFPGSTISFSEVLFADALTSMSKVFKDLGVTLVAVYAQATQTDIVNYHDVGMILIALLASAPFWIRIRQCWVQLEGSSDPFARTFITLNLIKYATAFPPIWLAAAASLGFFHPSLPTITAAMATLNSLYSFAWDISMDWGLLVYSRDGRFNTRQRYLWPFPSYFILVVLNFVLRFSWTANRIPFFAKMHASQLVLIVQLAEVFRRAVWNLYRIEWEVIVHAERTDKSGSASDGANTVVNRGS